MGNAEEWIERAFTPTAPIVTPDGTHKYVYHTISPSKTVEKREYPSLPGHRVGFKVRRDMLIPNGDVHRQVYCSCRWKSDKWTSMQNLLQDEWGKHYTEIARQGVLNV